MIEKFKISRFEKDKRYYILFLQKDMLGDWVITKINGRTGTQLGRVRHKAVNTYEEGIIEYNELSNYRLIRRKYSLLYQNRNGK